MTPKPMSADTMVERDAQTPLVDLLKRIPQDAILRWQEPDGLQAHCSTPIGKYAHEAADRLERLEAEKRLCVEALEPFAAKADEAEKHIRLWNKQWHDGTTMSVKFGDLRKARTTLSAVGEIRDHS